MIPDHLNENITVPKVPLGCKPRWSVNEERMHELIGAIHRRGEWCAGGGEVGGHARLRDPGFFKVDLQLIVGWSEELYLLVKRNLRRLEDEQDDCYL